MSGTDSATGDQQSRSVEQIEADLEATRRELGETIDAIGERLDVKTRVKQRASAVGTRVSHSAGVAVQQVKDAATDRDGRPDPVVLAVVGTVVAAVVAAVVVTVRRP